MTDLVIAYNKAIDVLDQARAELQKQTHSRHPDAGLTQSIMFLKQQKQIASALATRKRFLGR